VGIPPVSKQEKTMTVQRLQTTTQTAIERQASALDELRELHRNYEALTRQVDEDRRTIERLQDRLGLLADTLRNEQAEKAIINRKLIRLAEAMSAMHLLSGKAHEIMVSVQEYAQETPEEAEAEQESAREIVTQLPSNSI
jgi:ABC-type transporter Mla subunit MlaD